MSYNALDILEDFVTPDGHVTVKDVISHLSDLYNDADSSIDKFAILHEVEEAIRELRKQK